MGPLMAARGSEELGAEQQRAELPDRWHAGVQQRKGGSTLAYCESL